MGWGVRDTQTLTRTVRCCCSAGSVCSFVVLDESDINGKVLCELHKVCDLGFVESAHDDTVDLHSETSVDGGMDGLHDAIKARPTRDISKLGWVQRVQTACARVWVCWYAVAIAKACKVAPNVHSVQASRCETRQLARQQQSIRSNRQRL